MSLKGHLFIHDSDHVGKKNSFVHMLSQSWAGHGVFVPMTGMTCIEITAFLCMLADTCTRKCYIVCMSTGICTQKSDFMVTRFAWK